MPAQSKRYYSVKEAADLIGVSTNTIYTYLKEGQLQARRIGKGRIKILASSLLPYADAQKIETVNNTPPILVKPEPVEQPHVIEKPIIKLEKINRGSLVGENTHVEETNILLPLESSFENEIVPMKNDKVFWRLFKALSFVGLGIIYFVLRKLNLNFEGGYLIETWQILTALLPLGFLTAGLLMLLDVFFQKQLEYFDTLIHIYVILIVGFFAFITISNGQYGIFVFAASFTILLTSHLVTGLRNKGTFYDTFLKFSVLVSSINGAFFILYPSEFPFSYLSSLISEHQGLFGFFWFGITTVPILILLSSYGKNSKVFAPIVILCISVLRMVLATQLTVHGIWDTAYLTYLLGIFGLFLAWWKSAVFSISPNRLAPLTGSFIWVSIAILIGLGVVAKSTSELNEQSQSIILSNAEGGVAKIKGKIDTTKAVLTSNAGNAENLAIVKEADEEKNISLAKTIYNSTDLTERILILNAEGKAIGVYPRESLAQGTNFSMREYFKKTIESNKGYVSSVFTNILGNHTIVITEPIFEGNNIAGLIVLALDLHKLSLLIGNEAGTSTEIHVFDSNNIYAFGTETKDIGRKKEDLSYLATSEQGVNDLSEKKIYSIKNQEPLLWEFNVLVNENSLLSNSSYLNLLLSIFVLMNSVFSVFAGVAISSRKNENKAATAANLSASNVSLGNI